VSRRSLLFKKRLDLFTLMLERGRQGDVDALHHARIASRRLREIVPVLRLDRDQARKLSRRLRKATRRLGTVRELDVTMMLIADLQKSRGRHRGALARVAAGVSDARDAARHRLFGRREPPFARLAKKLEHALLKRHGTKKQAPGAVRDEADRAARWAVDARVTHRAGQLREALEEAGGVYLPERLHAVRVALKKMRYAVELSLAMAGRRPTAELRALKRGQDALGRLHDLQVLLDHVRRTQAAVTPPQLTVWRELDALAAGLEDECRQLHGRYMRERDALAAIAQRYDRRPVLHASKLGGAAG